MSQPPAIQALQHFQTAPASVPLARVQCWQCLVPGETKRGRKKWLVARNTRVRSTGTGAGIPSLGPCTGPCLFSGWLTLSSPSALEGRWSSASVTAASRLAGHWQQTHCTISTSSRSMNCSSTILSRMEPPPSTVPLLPLPELHIRNTQRENDISKYSPILKNRQNDKARDSDIHSQMYSSKL